MKERIFRSKGHIFIVDHEDKVVSAPHSVDKKDYPAEVMKYIEENYFVQLNIM